MTVLAFEAVDARPVAHAAIPTLAITLRITEQTGAMVDSIALRCQIRIEPQRRRYSDAEAARLLELFGETPRWGDTLRPFLWTHVMTLVGGFSGSTTVDLHVPCTYDFDVAAAKYLHGLDDGEIPLLLLFSGTVFTRTANGVGVTQIPWDRETSFRMPARVWRGVMDLYFPNTGWLRLRRETLDALLRFKAEHALPSWEAVVETLLQTPGAAA